MRARDRQVIRRSVVSAFVEEKYMTRAYQFIVKSAIGCLMVKDFLSMCVHAVMSLFKSRRKIVMGVLIALITVTFLNGGFQKAVESGEAQAQVTPRAFMAPQSLAASAGPVATRVISRDEIQKIRAENDYRVQITRERNRSRRDFMDFIGRAVQAVR